MSIDFSGYDQALTQEGIDPEQAGKLLNFARKTGMGADRANLPFQPMATSPTQPNPNPNVPRGSAMLPTGEQPKAQPLVNFGGSGQSTTPYLRSPEPSSMAGPADSGGGPLNFGGSQTAKAPSLQDRYNAVQDPQAPTPAKFTWGRLLKAIGVGALGGTKAGMAQYEKPNTDAQQQFEDQQAAADRQRKDIAGEAGVGREEADTREADQRTQDLQNPRTPAVKAEADKPVTMETGQGPIQYNPETKQWDRVSVGGQPVGPKESVQGDTNKVNPIVESEVGARPDAKNYPQGANDPKYKADSAAWGRKAEDVTNRMTGARGDAYNRSRPVEVLDTWNGNRPIRVSAQEQEDNPGRYVNAGQGVKAISGQTTADDIQGAVKNLRDTVGVLDSGSVNRSVIEAILKDPQTNSGNFFQNVAARQLSDKEQDYVIAILTAREVMPSLRNLLPGSGQATDARIKNMLETLPGARTAGSAMANKQLDAIEGTLKRVRPAIPNVKAQGQGAPGGGGKNGGGKNWNPQTGRYE